MFIDAQPKWVADMAKSMRNPVLEGSPSCSFLDAVGGSLHVVFLFPHRWYM